jgi:hypothetical protein
VLAATAETAQELSGITFGAASYLFEEGVGSGVVVLHIDPPSSTPVRVTVSSANIQAEASKDFEGLRQALVIEPNEPAYTLSLEIIDDALVEGEEQLRLTLSNYQEVSPGTITETLVTIVDNDAAFLSIGDVMVNENATNVSLVITQSISSTLQSVVDVRTVAESATAPEDYFDFFTTAVIPPGSTAATVTVQLRGDEEAEGIERFIVQLEDPTNAKLGKESATVTIIDDEVIPELGLETAEANETDGILPFVVTLSSPSDETVTVEYATRNGSAIAPGDYLTNTGVLTIAPGSTSATVAVTLVPDQEEETNETLFLVFDNPVQAILSSSEVEGVIHDTFTRRLFLPGLVRQPTGQ